MTIDETGLSPDQEKLVDKAIREGMRASSPLFLIDVTNSELTLHIVDPAVPSGMRSLRWYDVADVTDEFVSDDQGETDA